MKKVLLMSMVFAGITAMTSCAKDRVCECTTSTTGLITLSITTDTTFVNVSKGDAETKCSALNANYDDGTNTVDVDCALQ